MVNCCRGRCVWVNGAMWKIHFDLVDYQRHCHQDRRNDERGHNHLAERPARAAAGQSPHIPPPRAWRGLWCAWHVALISQLDLFLLQPRHRIDLHQANDRSCPAMNNGRDAGLVDWDAIEDRLRKMQKWRHYATPADAIERAARSMVGLLFYAASTKASLRSRARSIKRRAIFRARSLGDCKSFSDVATERENILRIKAALSSRAQMASDIS